MRHALSRSVCCLLSIALAATAAQAVPLVVSSYTYDSPAGWLPSGSYPDSSGSEMTDGTFATFPYTDAAWVGVIDGTYPVDSSLVYQPQISFALASPASVNSVSIYYERQIGAGIDSPDSVDISYSIDGITYTLPVNYTGFAAPDGLHTLTLSGLGIGNASYVRLGFVNDQPWTFLTEISFDGGAPSLVPEPSTWAILGLGALGLVWPARRRTRTHGSTI